MSVVSHAKVMQHLRTLKDGTVVEEMVEENFVNLETLCLRSNFLVLIFVYRRVSQR